MTRKSVIYIPILITILCFIISFSISWRVVGRVLRQQNRALASISAEKVYNEINLKLERSVTVGRYIAADSYIQDILEREDTLTQGEVEKLLTPHLDKITKQFGFTTISVISNATGNYYTNYGFNKIIDPENDSHDIWYNIFLEKNKPYDFDIDVDEVTGNTWTAFLNTRIENEKGELLGVSGVALTMPDMQKLLRGFQEKYDIKIMLVDKNGLVQVDVDDINIENVILDDIDFSDLSAEYTYTESDEGYTVSRIMENLGWILLIFKDYGNSREVFYDLLKENLLVMLCIMVAISIIMYYLLRRNQWQIEKNYVTQLSAAARIYYTLHIIDLKRNVFSEINAATDDIKHAIGDDLQNADISMQGVMRQTVDEHFLDTMLQFTDLSTVADRLVEKDTIAQEFLGKDNVWARARFITVEKDSNGRVSKVFFAVEIIDEEKRRENKLRQLSETDGLTGINNRAAGEKAIKEYMASKTEGMFGLLDADKFKSVNDTYGHAMGDEVICAIAKALKSSFRGHDVVMRLGGDEFAFFAVGVTDTKLADMVIKRFFAAIDAIEIPELTDYTIHVSLGAAYYTADSDLDFTRLYNKADEGTYASKKIHGNAYTII